ncbi:MAG: glycosyltransferase family 2 protein [Sedimentisphaerales bacterium]|nr:glycosyltransferase family 2 protein [Sedimentisphaerales bacterium]
MAQVTIVLPLYNKEEYVARAVRSIQYQSLEDWKLIVVDDGSTDSGPEIVRQIEDPRIELVRQENQGPGAARNKGIALAETPYVAFLDADDEWYPWYLANALRAMEESDVALVATVYCLWPEKVDIIESLKRRDIPLGEYDFQGDEDPMWVKGVLSVVQTWNSFIRTEVVRKYGGFFDKYRCLCGEDLTLFLRISFNEKFKIIYPAAVRYHAECSDLWSARKVSPLPPYLENPDEVLRYCPPAKSELMHRLIVCYALFHARRWSDQGVKIPVIRLIKQYPEIKQDRQEYIAVLKRLVPGFRTWSLFKNYLIKPIPFYCKWLARQLHLLPASVRVEFPRQEIPYDPPAPLMPFENEGYIEIEDAGIESHKNRS